MTSAHPTGHALGDILAQVRYLLLDFDGPICQIFAGLPAEAVADRLRKLITSHGTQLPGEIAITANPFDVFAYAATISPQLAARVEAEMSDLEQTAIATAKPTPYVHEVITGCRESGRTVAVVSNNSDQAVRAYLTRHGLGDRIDLVIARTSPDPDLLKPSPHLLERAITALGAQPSQTALVGDSTTDIDAAHHAGIHSIGYANKPGKHARLTNAGAQAVITSLADLVLPLRARPLPN